MPQVPWDEADAQDAVMDLFEEVSGKIEQYDIRTSTPGSTAWLRIIAWPVYESQAAHFREYRRGVYGKRPPFTLMDRERSDEESALHFCMKELGEEQRRSLEFLLRKQVVRRYCRPAGYPLNKVKSYIQNGKRNLKNCIERVLKSL